MVATIAHNWKKFVNAHAHLAQSIVWCLHGVNGVLAIPLAVKVLNPANAMFSSLLATAVPVALSHSSKIATASSTNRAATSKMVSGNQLTSLAPSIVK
jgi:hypothetical protein